MGWRGLATSTAVALMALAGLVALAPRFADGEDVPSAEVSFELYTHCGIDEAFFQGRYYEAVRPLSDGHGNPPPGWDNPEQRGTMRVISATQIRFHSTAGDVVLRLRPDATGFKHLCA